jgi:HK97 family phage portal protein
VRWPWQRRDDDAPELRAITFQDVWGAGREVSTAASVTPERALTLAPVYAATSLLADQVSACPLHAYRKVGAQRTELDPQPGLITEPSIYGSSVDWVHRAVISMALRGNAFGLITGRDSREYPRQIEWLHPDDVTVEDDRAEGPPKWRYRNKPIDASSLLHIPYYTVPGYIMGLSPVKAFAMAVDVGLFAAAFGRDYFRNGSVPAGILKTDQRIDDESRADVIKARFKRDAARREPVVLGSGLDYQTISVAPNESQFLQTIKATATTVATIYHLRPDLIGGEAGGSSITYANVEQQALEIMKISLLPYIRRIESALAPLLPGSQYVRFNVDHLVRADIETRYKAHSLALTDGWMSKDEVRELEELSPMPRGLGGFPKPVAPAAPAVGPTGDGNPANGNGTAPNGAAPAPHGPSGSNGGPVRSALRLDPWGRQISLAGRRADPWA